MFPTNLAAEEATGAVGAVLRSIQVHLYVNLVHRPGSADP